MNQPAGYFKNSLVQPGPEGVGGRKDTCIHMIESLCVHLKL